MERLFHQYAETIRLVLTMSVELKMYLYQMDVCTAYLNSRLSETVYMKQPKIFDDDECKDRVLRLNKAIYGLKQAGREWNATLDEALREIGFVPCQYEACLYKQDISGNLCLVLIYVDDLLIVCQSRVDLVQVKSKIASRFECVDKGLLNTFLGMQIEREGELGRITMNQTLYIKDMEQCKADSDILRRGISGGV